MAQTFDQLYPGHTDKNFWDSFFPGIFPRLKERRTQLAGTLSGGERQMLAMARALMNRPRLLLLHPLLAVPSHRLRRASRPLAPL